MTLYARTIPNIVVYIVTHLKRIYCVSVGIHAKLPQVGTGRSLSKIIGNLSYLNVTVS